MADRIVTIDGKTHQFPADATDAEISAALKAVPAKNASEAPKSRTWTDTAVDAIPAVAGAVGGLMGAASGIPTLGLTSAPAALAGATILGAGGEALKQGINRMRGSEAPTTALDAAMQIGKEGAIQGGAQALGSGAAVGMKALARPVMESAIGRSTQMLNPKAPDVVATALKSGAVVTKSGVQKLDDLIASTTGLVDKAALQATRNAVAKAWARSKPETLFGATANHPAFKSAMAQGLYHVAGLVSGLTPQLIRAAVLGIQEGDTK